MDVSHIRNLSVLGACVKFSDLDVFYISYDEPNCEHNWADLLAKVPWAQRVHGVHGSDTAHKHCASRTKEDHFVTIDGDNIIDPQFFDQDRNLDAVSIYSWSGRNIVNGLVYGNGGIKVWPTKVVHEMKTHEIAESPQAQVDFCWYQHYIQMDQVFSVAHINGSPLQAWRAGFREGVKMSLSEGVRVDRLRMEEVLHRHNYERLKIWCSVGADVEHGLWAIYGARLGVYKTFMEPDWDFTQVRDFRYLNHMWEEEFDIDITKALAGMEVLEIHLKSQLHLDIVTLSTDDSRWFKSLYRNPGRTESA